MTLQTTLGRFAIATTEYAKKPFCIIDRWSGGYVADERGLICKYRTLGEAQKALSVMHDAQNVTVK